MWRVCLLAIVVIALVGCEGDQGPAGPPGSPGSGVETPQEFLDADGILGGAAYTKWWTTDAAGTGTQPTTAVAADFYRCKACHAWDGLGNMASYANRTGQSTLNPARPDVAGLSLRASALANGPQELFDLIARAGGRDIDASDNTHPDFSSLLSNEQIWNLAKFMKEEWVAPNLLYDLEVSGSQMYVDYTAIPPVVVSPTVTYTNVGSLGNEANGQAIVAASCATCHGADGTTIDIGGRSLGQFVREKPNEAWFKAKFGEPGTGMMPGLVSQTSDLQDMYSALANPTNFPDP